MPKTIERCAENKDSTINHHQRFLEELEVAKIVAHLLTRITMVVMSAARKTKPPKELSAMMEVRLSFAPYVEELTVSSLSTGVGTFTSGTWLCL